MNFETLTVAVTAFGETRDVEFTRYSPTRLSSTRYVVVGRFPTGTKLHKSDMDLWRRDQSYTDSQGVARTPSPLRGPTAAVIDGEEYVMGTTLYIHNSNRGRIVAWNDEKWNPYLGRWN